MDPLATTTYQAALLQTALDGTPDELDQLAEQIDEELATPPPRTVSSDQPHPE